MTVVVTHRVSPEHVDEFLAWQERLRLAESTFDGFRGTELFRPVEGVQDEWTALYRYDNAADLDTWLISDERQALLAEGEEFSRLPARAPSTTRSAAGSRSTSSGQEAPPPSDIKTSIAVWVGLYPTVVLLTLALSPLHMPLWLGMLVGNLMSSFIMSFFTMPYYVNPLLKRWLRPPPNVPEATDQSGGASPSSVAAMAFWTVGIYLVTTPVLAPALTSTRYRPPVGPVPSTPAHASAAVAPATVGANVVASGSGRPRPSLRTWAPSGRRR